MSEISEKFWTEIQFNCFSFHCILLLNKMIAEEGYQPYALGVQISNG